MPANIQDVLAYEIKKEIADRYFGFRKLIEEDNLDLKEKTVQHRFILEKRISFDLIRIYILLGEEQIIREFLHLTGFEEELFYDPYLTESETIKARVFQGSKLRGFTWRGRHRNMIIDTYERLVVHVAQYCEKSNEIRELTDSIQEEIRIFDQKNDLGSIIGFLRSLNSSTHSGMQGGMETGIAESLQQKMKIQHPTLESVKGAIIKPLPPISTFKGELKRLIKKAYKLHGESFRLLFSKHPASTGKVQR